MAQRSLIFKGYCSVAFREALSIGAKHQGHMEIVRHVQTQQPSKMNLSWSCFKKIVAAHDFADALFCIIDDDGKVVGGSSIGTTDHKVINDALVVAREAVSKCHHCTTRTKPK